MKRVLILSFLFLSSCKPETICDFETNQCHTKEEWNRISERNWKAVKCLQKQFDNKISIKKAYKKCGLIESTRVEFK